jgi:hypothetical protein
LHLGQIRIVVCCGICITTLPADRYTRCAAERCASRHGVPRQRREFDR